MQNLIFTIKLDNLEAKMSHTTSSYPSYYIEILVVMAADGPLNAKMLIEKTGASESCVRHYLMFMRRAGQVHNYKNIRGMYEITEQGKKELEVEKNAESKNVRTRS